MSVIIDALKRVRSKGAEIKSGRNIRMNLVVFAAISIFIIAFAAIMLYGLNANVKSITKNTRIAEDRMRNLEKSSEYLADVLKRSNVLLKDLTAGASVLEKKAASNEEGVKRLSSEIAQMNTAVKSLQKEYGSVPA
ncbi:MAG: hypothetical protein WC482_05430, partial [Candidatus Omnitrophota bacterium]